MSELRKEYQAIFDALCEQEGISADTILKCALQECQDLADSKEPVMLTDEEVRKIYISWNTVVGDYPTLVRMSEAAVHAKQRAPVVKDVVVRIYQDSDGSIITTSETEIKLGTWTLLKEVTIPVETK